MDVSQIVPISDLPRKYDELLKRRDPVILFKRNKPVGVLMDYNNWNQYSEYKRQFELSDAMEAVVDGEKAYKEGKVKELKSPEDLWKQWKN